MDKLLNDATLGTIGWFAFAASTIGLTAGQTLRVSVVNVSASDATVLCGVWQNPHPLSLAQDSSTLRPGEARNCDLKASDLPRGAFDKTGRAQVRAFIRCSSRAICSHLELFDSKSGRTSVVVPLHEVPHLPLI